MSLRVWLPLRGSLENLGTDEVELTNNGATVSTQGKIGSCYNFGGSAYMVSTGTSLDIGVKSVCFWAYISNTGNYVLFTDYKSGLAFGVYSSYIPVSCSASITVTYPKSLVTLNQWNHFAVVKRDSTIELWINGEKQTKGSNTDRWSSGITDKLAIGARPNGNDKLNGRLNDFRMYDHALSEKEIHDISKALVLHYPLNDPWIETTTNIGNALTDTCYNASTKKYGYGANTDIYKEDGYFQDRDCTKVHMGTSGLAAWPYVYFPIQTDVGVTKTLSFDYYPSTLNTIRFYNLSTNTSLSYEINGTKGTANNSFSATVNVGKWNHIVMTTTNVGTASGGMGYMMIGTAAHTSDVNNYWLFANIMVEEKDHATGYTKTSRTEAVVPDCSGFHNDGIANKIEIDSDSPRYDICSEFTSSNSSYIKVNDNKWMAEKAPELTINVWCYADDWESLTNVRLFSCTESGGFNVEPGNSGYLRFPNSVYTTASGSVAYKYSSNELKKADLSPGWHMLTFVKNLDGNKVYVDGELHSSYAFVNYGEHFNFNARLFLGCEANTANPSSPYFTGKMSDFRLYYTELSADDIKELYEVGASIDNLQNMHTYWYEEDVGNLINVPDVYDKTTTSYFSQFSTDYELIAGKTYSFSVEVETNEFPYYISIGYGKSSYTRDIAYGSNQTENGLCTIIFTAPNASTLEANGSTFCFRAPRRNSSKTYTYSMINPRLTMIDSGIIPSIKKNGIVEANTFAEGDAWDAKVFKSGDISAKELIEI